MSNSMRPHRRQPTRLLHPWHFPGKNTGLGCHFLLQWMKVKSEKWKVKVKLSHVWLLATPWTATHQAPPSTRFSRQEYWTGVPLPSPEETLRAWFTLDNKFLDLVAKQQHQIPQRQNWREVNFWDCVNLLLSFPLSSCAGNNSVL